MKTPVFYFIHKGQVQATKTFQSWPPFRPFLVKSVLNSAADLSGRSAQLTASWPLLSYAAEHSASNRATRTLPNPLHQFSNKGTAPQSAQHYFTLHIFIDQEQELVESPMAGSLKVF